MILVVCPPRLKRLKDNDLIVCPPRLKRLKGYYLIVLQGVGGLKDNDISVRSSERRPLFYCSIRKSHSGLKSEPNKLIDQWQ